MVVTNIIAVEKSFSSSMMLRCASHGISVCCPLAAIGREYNFVQVSLFAGLKHTPISGWIESAIILCDCHQRGGRHDTFYGIEEFCEVADDELKAIYFVI